MERYGWREQAARTSSLLYLNDELDWSSAYVWPSHWLLSPGLSFLSHAGSFSVIGVGYSKDRVYASSNGLDWESDGTIEYKWGGVFNNEAVSFMGSPWLFAGEYIDYYFYEPEGDEYVSATILLPDILKVENGNWDAPILYPAPWPLRTESVGLAFAGKLWVIGGRTTLEAPIDFAEFQPLNDAWYSEDGETWIEATSSASWCPRNGHACVVFQDKLWLLGGHNGYRALNDVWVSHDGATWSQVAAQAPWRGRSGHSAVVYQDKLWVIAGHNGSEALSDIWVYDPAAAEGEGEGEGEPAPQRYYHSADKDTDREISLNELLRVVQFYNSDGLHCEPCTEDDYDLGAGDQGCRHHDSDYAPEDWMIDLSELLRLIQLYNMDGYHPCTDSEDGFCPGAA